MAELGWLVLLIVQLAGLAACLVGLRALNRAEAAIAACHTHALEARKQAKMCAELAYSLASPNARIKAVEETARSLRAIRNG